VLATDPRFAGTGPPSNDMVGQSRWYEAAQTADGFSVSVTLGSGDCQAGCIERHTWHYSVSPDGAIALVSEEGGVVDTSPPVPLDEPATVQVRVEASPICPVERIPPDPGCAPRGVADFDVVLNDPSGTEVARATTDANGSLTFSVPTGVYYIEPVTQPEVFFGITQGAAFSIVGGLTMYVVISIDTGIR